MRIGLGEEGTEQFEVTTRVDGKTIRQQAIHDPFVHSTCVLVMDWWSCFKGLFSITARTGKVEVSVSGSRAVVRRIMAIDPVECQIENESCPRCGFPDGSNVQHACPDPQPMGMNCFATNGGNDDSKH